MIEKISNEEVKELSLKWESLSTEIGKIVFGQEKIITKTLLALIGNSHVLLEGVPGLAKTTLVKTLARCLGLKFSRIQFTPDLLPADVVGSVVYNPKEHNFYTKKGPVFANIVLADEINRAPAKVQSALLEAMEERQVTIGSETFELESPLIVLATQNPIEQEGTYLLPEAQNDRFMFKLVLDYPSREAEKNMLQSKNESIEINQILTSRDVLLAQSAAKRIFIDDKVVNYILDIVAATRGGTQNSKFGRLIKFGASPRATIFLSNAAKAKAFLSKRNFVIPEDVKFVVADILRHRITLSYEAEIEGFSTDTVIKFILDNVLVP